MRLKAVIICCIIVVNAEQPLDSYSFAGNNNGYDYTSNGVTNDVYLGSKDSYQTSGHFYNGGNSNHKLSSHISGHQLINSGNQDIRSDMGNGYTKYSMNDYGSEYAGYPKSYENFDGDPYALTNHAMSIPVRGYSSSNSNGELPTFNAYSSDSIYKDSDYGQFAVSNTGNQKIPSYPGYSKSTLLENYPEGTTDNIVPVYHGSSATPSYSESDHVYQSYSPGSIPANEYVFGKQKESSSTSSNTNNKYSDAYLIPTEMRYARGNMEQVSHNHRVPQYPSANPGSNNHFSKLHSSNIYFAGKPYKYGYKYLSRYAPNNGVTYLLRTRDVPKGTKKIIIIKNNRLNHAGGPVYPDDSLYAGSGDYRSKRGGFANMGVYPISPNFDAYATNTNSGMGYDDDPVLLRRYRTNGGPMLVRKTVHT